MRWTHITLAASACLSAPAVAAAQGYAFKTLTVGDRAPALDVTHWLKGDPVQTFEKGKVYLIEFWATWCGPCRVSVPHLAELQEEYRDYDVTIVAVSNEDLQTVVEFMAKADSKDRLWFHKMGYTVATDPDQSTRLDYTASAGLTTIPQVFLVGKDGRVEWIGHPSEMDEPLEAVVRNRWDRDAFYASWEEKMADRRARMGPFYRFQKAKSVGAWQSALDAVEALIAANEDETSYKVQKFMLLVRDLDEPTKGYAYGRQVAKAHWDDSSVLNSLAWNTVDKKGIETRDLDFAMKLAQRACALTDYENAAILDTLARVYYEQGDFESAAKWQRKAVEHAGSEAMKDDLAEVLVKYEKKSTE